MTEALTMEEKREKFRRLQQEVQQLRQGEAPKVEEAAPTPREPTPAPETPTPPPTPRAVQEAPEEVKKPLGALQNIGTAAQQELDLGGVVNRKGTLWENADLATGPLPGIARAFNSTVGAIPGIPNVQDVDFLEGYYRQVAELAAQTLSKSSRTSNTEIQRIRRDLDIEPAFFKDPEKLREKLDAADTTMRRLLSERLRVLEEEGLNLDEPQRKEAQREILAIQSYLDAIGAPAWENLKGKGAQSRIQQAIEGERPQEEQFTPEEVEERAEEFGAVQEPSLVERFRVTDFLETGVPTAMQAVGARLGGAVGGAIGGMSGAAIGDQLARIAFDAEQLLRYGEAPERTMAEQFTQMWDAATTDAIFQGLFLAPARSVSQLLKTTGKFTGAQSPEVTEAIREGLRNNVRTGAIDVDKPFFQLTGRAFGVLPVVGGPLRKAAGVRAVEESRQFQSILDTVSPSIDLPKLGVNINRAAQNAWQARRDIAGTFYTHMRQNFEHIGDPQVVPTTRIKTAVTDLLGEGTSRLPRTPAGEPIGMKPFPKDFEDELRKFLKLPNKVKFSRLEALQQNLNRAARGRKGALQEGEYRAISSVNRATWSALDKLSPDDMRVAVGEQVTLEEAGQLFRDTLYSIKRAKRHWANTKALEETAAAAKFKRVDKNYFAAGFEKPGPVEIDELANVFLTSNSLRSSPRFVKNLDALMGSENRRALARTVLYRAAAPKEEFAKVGGVGQPERLLFPRMEAPLGETKILAFDPETTLNNLGLVGEGSRKGNKATLNALLEGTGVTADNVEGFLRFMARRRRTQIGDPSSFVTRSMVLRMGGGRGAPSVGLGEAASVAPALIATTPFVLGGRAFARLISTPRGLKLLREGWELGQTGLNRQQMFNLAQRVVREFPEFEVQNMSEVVPEMEVFQQAQGAP